MPSLSELLERESTTVDLEPGDFERLAPPTRPQAAEPADRSRGRSRSSSRS